MSRFSISKCIALSFLIVLGVGCSTPNTQEEDEMIGMDQETQGSSEATNASEEDPFDEAETESPQENAETPEESLDEELAEKAEPTEDLDESLEPLQADSLTPEEPTPVPTPDPVVAEPVQPTASVNITDIRFMAEQGGGTLIVEGDQPLNHQSRMNAEGSQFVVEIPGAMLPEKLKRPFLMKDFKGSSFGAVNAYQKPGATTARIVIQLKPNAQEPLIEAQGNSLMIVPGGMAPPPTIAQTPPPDEDAEVMDVHAAKADEKILGARTLDEFMMGSQTFYGKPISIQIKDADIRDVLNFISDESGANLVISDDVKGKVSIKLRQIPWDQALVTIMRANSLGYIRQGNVIRISGLEALKTENDVARQVLESQRALIPLRVRVIPVNFAKVEDLPTELKPFLSKDKGGLIADNRTNSLIVTDNEETVERIARLVRELDRPPEQVMIEGKIVEAMEEFTRSIGVNWSMNGVPQTVGNGSEGQVKLTPNLNIAPTPAEMVPFMSLGVNVGTLDILGNLNASLLLAEQDRLVKVISSPRVVAMNKEQAKIRQQSEQITFSTIKDPTGGSQTGVVRTPIVVELDVTPQITSDGNVIMDIKVDRDFAGAVVEKSTNARPVNSRKVATKILVRNGQTAVIGGIYQSDASETENGVPVLKDVPVLGWLFKYREKETSKNELLIFLTPRILNPADNSSGSSTSS